jgi:nucleotide-binding universal stress UspA family protein
MARGRRPTSYLRSPVAPILYLRGNYRDHLETSAQAAEEHAYRVLTGVSRGACCRPRHPAEVLLREIKESATDLVVMTSHGRGGFMRWVLGSVTDRVIRGSAPVLVIRPGGAIACSASSKALPKSIYAPRHAARTIEPPRRDPDS